MLVFQWCYDFYNTDENSIEQSAVLFARNFFVATPSSRKNCTQAVGITFDFGIWAVSTMHMGKRPSYPAYLQGPGEYSWISTLQSSGVFQDWSKAFHVKLHLDHCGGDLEAAIPRSGSSTSGPKSIDEIDEPTLNHAPVFRLDLLLPIVRLEL